MPHGHTAKLGSAHVLALESTLDSQPTCRVCECLAGAASYGRSALDSRAVSLRCDVMQRVLYGIKTRTSYMFYHIIPLLELPIQLPGVRHRHRLIKELRY